MAYSFSAKTCYTCGKQFIPAPMNVFKRKINGKVWHFCSYKCLNLYTRAKRSKNDLTEEDHACYNKKGGDIPMTQKAPKNRLQEYRNRSRLTLREVSILTGYDVSTISKHESGNRRLTEEAIDKYAALYKVKTYEIFDLRGSNE